MVGRYAIYEPIATGGMATIHLGRLLGPLGFSRTVAVKRLHAQFAHDPEFVAMFTDEARLAARIAHPNVVQTLDVVATDGELFLVMEYVRGESLSKLIRVALERTEDGPPIEPAIVVAIVSAMLQGLHAAHEAVDERGRLLGLVHRDVSPQNVLVGLDGTARVLDFGVAKAENRMSSTRDGQLKGKLLYMSPEQLEGEDVDRKTDIYASAIVLFETLTGQRMFAGKSEGLQIAKITRGEITLPGAVDPTLAAFDAIVAKGAAKDRSERFETAMEMAVALEKCAQPATQAQVAAWVSRLAGDVIRDRSRKVAEIEREVSISELESGVVPSRPHAMADERAQTKRRRWLVVAAMVLLCIAGAATLFFQAGRSTPGLPASAPHTPALPVSDPSVLPTAEPAPVQASARAQPAPPPKPAQKSRPAPQGSAAGPDCEQPYVVDSVGHMHFRKECL